MPNVESEITKSQNHRGKWKPQEKKKQLAIVDLESCAQWKANTFPEVSYTKLLSHIITKNTIILEPPQETLINDTTSICIGSEIKIWKKSTKLSSYIQAAKFNESKTNKNVKWKITHKINQRILSWICTLCNIER